MEKLKNQLLRSIVLLGLLLVLPVWGGAEAATASGSCGSNLRWTLDDAGLLTITGTDLTPADAPTEQMGFFDQPDKREHEKLEKLEDAMASIREKYGKSSIGYGKQKVDTP